MEKPIILDGQKVAEKVKTSLVERVLRLKNHGVQPCLATILVGDDPSSATYVKMKGNACARLGIESRKIELPNSTTTEELLDVIHHLNLDPHVHGILLQHPVPKQIDERKAFDAISIQKDVDGVTSIGYGQTALGFGNFPSCTPAAIIRILDEYKLDVQGLHVVVVGRSPILGKPASALLLNRNATVTTCHSYTKNLVELLGIADIVVAAVGIPNFIKGEWLKRGAIVLDAGYNPGNIGDVDYASCLDRVSAITPVPGGVGPVTISMLLKHTVDSADATLE